MFISKRGLYIICAVLLFCIYAGELAFIYSITPDPCEDAYITFRFSKNLAEGNGPVFNPGERVEGYSNPLWMASAALAAKLGLDMAFCSRMAGALFNSLTLLLVWFIPWRWFRLRGPASFIGPVLYLLFLPLQFYAASGLETSFYTFLLSAAAAAMIWAQEDRRRSMITCFLLLLASLTRPEGIIFFMFYCAWIFSRYYFKKQSLKPYLPGIILFSVLYGAFLLWRLSYYGLLLPNTYYVKGSFPLYVRIFIGYFVNKSFFANYPWFLILLPVFFFVKINDARRALPALYLFIAAGFVFSLFFSGWDWMPYFRYNIPVVPLMIICFHLMAIELWRRMRRTSRGRLLWGAAVACLLLIVSEQYWKDLAFNYRWRDLGEICRYNQKSMGEWIGRELGKKPVIAIGDVGYFAFISQATIIDLYGLTSKEFAEIKTRYGSPDISFLPPSVTFSSFKKKELELLLQKAPDYVFLYSMRLKISDTYPGSAAGIDDDPAFRKSYDYLTSFSVVPDFASNNWPRSIHMIDVSDLSTGMIAWMRTGWGYDVYIRKDSPYPRFQIELGQDDKIKNIVAVKSTQADKPRPRFSAAFQ